jgi:hypothetical protein
VALPESPRFDLADPSQGVFRGEKLWCPTVMQCAGYDHINDRWYVAQVMYNRGDGVPYWRRKYQGDIAITKLSADGSEKLGRMYLRGFGHGAQIGVEPTGPGTPPYLWIEYDSKPNDDCDPEHDENCRPTGFGSRLCRIKYVGPPADEPPRSFHWDDASDREEMDFRDRTPDPVVLPGEGDKVGAPRAAIDPGYGRVLVRFNRNDNVQCAVWDLKAATAPGRLGEPMIHRPNIYNPPTPQGFCLYGSYMYMLEGNPYGDDNPPPGNTYITRLDLNTGEEARKRTEAFGDVSYREPEGMNIMLVPGPTGGDYVPRLTFGFASGEEGDRRINIAYKDRLVV